MATYSATGLAIFDSSLDPPLDNRPNLSSAQPVCIPVLFAVSSFLISVIIVYSGIRLRGTSTLLPEMHATRFRCSQYSVGNLNYT